MKSAWTAQNIKELRLRLGWSQSRLAEKLGCRQQTVSEWETGSYVPQNAYSKLLDMLLEESIIQASHDTGRKRKDLNKDQITDEQNEVAQFVKDDFDLQID